MVEIQTLVDEGVWRCDEALRLFKNSARYAAWLNEVGWPTLNRLLLKRELFTTDELWEEFGAYPSPSERRVMGALVKLAWSRGVVAKTGVYVISHQPVCHGRQKALWKSLLYQKVAPVMENDSSNGTEYEATL